MADPTYRVVNAAPWVHVLRSQVQVVYRFAYPSAQRTVKMLHVPLGPQMTSRFGLSRNQRSFNPIRLHAEDFRYVFRFFYPSNGTVPGSPIPRSGQVAPRPI